MMRGYIIRESDGRMMYCGRVQDKKGLMDGDQPKAGYSILPSSTRRPSESIQEPMWDGSKWVKSETEQKLAKEKATREKDLEKLRVKRRAGKRLTATETMTLLDHFLGM